MLGNLAETVKDFNTCIKTCAEGKTIAHRHKIRFEESSFDYVAGKCMFDLDLEDEGLSLMKASIDKMKPIVKTDSDYGHLIFFVNNLIICYLSDETMQQALDETETLEQLIDGMEKKYPEAKSYCERYRYHVYAERAVAKVNLGRSDEAQADFDQALTYDFSNTHVGMSFQMDYYSAAGNVDSMLSIMARCPYRDTDTVQRLYRRRLSLMAQAYREAGDTAMTDLYQHRIDTLSQLIERREQQEGLAVNAAQYDTQVHRLALEELTKNTKKMYIFLVSLVVVMTLAFSVFFLANKRRLTKAAKEMRQKSQSMEEEMTRLQKQVRIIARDNSQSPSETSQQASKSLSTLIEGQQLYLKKDISRALMAQMLGCSHQTLTKMLNEIQPDISFPDYIKGLRIAHALKLIKENPSLTVQQVADQSGFYSISSFERSFKAITGKTPREYQKNS
jgi:AraC-like DNA-binding protein